MMQWTVTPSDHKTRLDIFLRDRTDDTRSALAKLIKAGMVTVNGAPASVHRFLRTGDIVRLEDRDVVKDMEPRLRGDGKKEHEDGKKERVGKTPLLIIKETQDWLVINKPSGVLVHPDAKTKTETLVDLLIAHDPKIAKIGENPSRPGIMHRLDKDVSGLMVVAKTQDAFDHLKKQFAEHSVDKTYLALAYGSVPQDEGDIKFRIARARKGTRMAARPETETAGRAAWTHYKVITRFRTATLLELEIYTGRTHQIRAHLFGLGHPVVGDPLYKPGPKTKRIDAPRILLQAIRLAFTDPKTGRRETFTLPPELVFRDVERTLSPL